MITSFGYLAFLAAGVVLYYVFPKKIRWVVLLALSVFYYLAIAEGGISLLFLVASTLIAYAAGYFIEKNREDPSKATAIKRVAVAAVTANAVLWFLVKGSSFWIGITGLLHSFLPTIPVLGALPVVEALGMGYYTAQVIGYIVDVWWDNCRPQTNPLKLFLFVCFFPQLVVGPISRYGELSHIYDGHPFSYTNITRGCQRILWGFYKKLVIADRAGVFISAIWDNTATYNGLWAWMAVLVYPIRIYCDFSGCMDIVLGSAELFGVTLAENFNNPFYAKSTQEFWQRWHITLGAWARDYVYYPLLKSKWLITIGRKCKKKYGKRFGKLIPWTIAMAVLWFVMGFWHGSVQHIFGVSLWFFTCAFCGEVFAPALGKITRALNIRTESFSWSLFLQARTYFLYALGAVFFSAPGMKGVFDHYRVLFHSFTVPNFWILFDGRFLAPGNMTWRDVNLIIFGVVCLLFVAHLRETYGYARNWIAKQGFILRWAIWFGLLFMVLIYGMYGPGYDAASFIYQNF